MFYVGLLVPRLHVGSCATCAWTLFIVAAAAASLVYVAGTNYIMWYPFRASSSALPVPSDPDLLFRYTISFK